MKRLAILILAISMTQLTAAPVPKELKNNDSIQGTWKVESLILFGQPGTESLYWSIDADGNLDRHSDPVPPANTIRSIILKQNRAAKTLDFCAGPMTFPGTYRLSGDTLEYCIAMQGQARPATIGATPAKYLWTLTRVKPGEKK